MLYVCIRRLIEHSTLIHRVPCFFSALKSYLNTMSAVSCCCNNHNAIMRKIRRRGRNATCQSPTGLKSTLVPPPPPQLPIADGIIDRPKTPLTPKSSKKAFMETLLTPAHSTQEEIFDKEKVAELFMPGHTHIGITVSFK